MTATITAMRPCDLCGGQCVRESGLDADGNALTIICDGCDGTGSVMVEVAPMPPLPTPADIRAALVARPVLTEADALVLGRVRDRQRAGFSNDNSPIDDDRQRAWWAGWHNRINAYLYYDGASLVGYSALIQRMDGTWVSSLAVLPEHEGRRFGRAMLHHLIASVGHEVYAQARADNIAACALHNPLDWEETERTHHLVQFRTRPRIRTEYPVTLGGYE